MMFESPNEMHRPDLYFQNLDISRGMEELADLATREVAMTSREVAMTSRGAAMTPNEMTSSRDQDRSVSSRMDSPQSVLDLDRNQQ